MNPAVGGGREPSTTSGAIAVVNLHAQIDGRAARADRLALIDLLTLRGQVLGRIADYERAAELAEQLVRGGRADGGAANGGAGGGAALLARARTRATFHRFADALADLDAAEDRGGCDRAALGAERAVILQAIGSGAEAGKLHRRAVVDAPGFATLGALAVFHAERGEIAQAEGLFDQARGRYLGTSPFPVASLDFRRGLMWHREGNLPAARAWVDASCRRVPAYAPALGHLAEIDAAAGAHDAAIRRLLPLVSASDDPAYAAGLACALSAAGHRRAAGQWRTIAAARYDELARRHPHAYAGHAADFRHLGGGGAGYTRWHRG
jgi:tetratricopeptide (TPR) repeat protein